MVWKDTKTLEIERFDNCIIFDAENWRCAQGMYTMRDGSLQRTAIDREYNVYRLGWWKWQYVRLTYLLDLGPSVYMLALKSD